MTEVRPCKIGTQPFLVRVHGADTVAIGRIIRVKTDDCGKWRRVLVQDVQPNGYFFADFT